MRFRKVLMILSAVTMVSAAEGPGPHRPAGEGAK